MMGDSGDTYFENYEDLEVHELMLRDEPRNESYRSAIFDNIDVIKGKVVMDVGAGTGILSVYFAQAGASKVYAVEASDFAKIAEEVVKENNFSDTIKVIQSRVEDLILPDDEKVDIIVSEWMGFYLLHEGMLDSVIAARDKFLKEDGIMYPQLAILYAAPCSVPEMFDFWHNVNGISMRCVGERQRVQKSSKPDIRAVKGEDLLSEGVSICCLDLQDVTREEIDEIVFKYVVGCTRTGKYQGMCFWFDCMFPASETCKKQWFLSTSPKERMTHWKQTVVILPNELELEEGEPIAFEIQLKRSLENPRRYNIEFTMLDPEQTEHPLPCTCHMTKCIVTKAYLEQHCEKSDELDGESDDEDYGLVDETDIVVEMPK